MSEGANLNGTTTSAPAILKFPGAPEGWTVRPEHHDDAGYSRGTMDRPALQQLLADIAAGRIDLLVTYKILIGKLFDEAGCPLMPTHATKAGRRYRLAEEPRRIGAVLWVKVRRHRDRQYGCRVRESPRSGPAVCESGYEFRLPEERDSSRVQLISNNVNSLAAVNPR